MSIKSQGTTLFAAKRGNSAKPLLNYTSSADKKKKGNITSLRKSDSTAANMSNGLSSRTNSQPLKDQRAAQLHRLKPDEVNAKMNRPPDIQPVRGGNMNMNRITPQYIESFWLHLKQETDNIKSRRREQSPVTHNVSSVSNTAGPTNVATRKTSVTGESGRNLSAKARPIVNTATQRRTSTPTGTPKGAAQRIPSPNTSAILNYSTNTNAPGERMARQNGSTPKSSSAANPFVAKSPSVTGSLRDTSSRTSSANKNNRTSPSIRSLSGRPLTTTRSLTPAGLHSPYKVVAESGRLGTPPRDRRPHHPPSATNAATELLRSLTNKYVYDRPGFGVPLSELHKRPASSSFVNNSTRDKTGSLNTTRPVVGDGKSSKKPPIPKIARAKSAPVKKDVKKPV